MGSDGVVCRGPTPPPRLLTLPTVLTIGRVAAVPLLITTFYMEGPWAATATTIIFLTAAVTDWLDGYIARKMRLGTAFGAFLDPVADKLMVAATLVLLCTKPLETSLLGDGPWLLTVPSIAIIGREITMSAVREWAASQSSKVLEAVAVNKLGKSKTATQMTALTLLLASRDPRLHLEALRPSPSSLLFCNGCEVRSLPLRIKFGCETTRMDHPGTMQCSSGSGGDGVRTVECLRGRLLAERVASKAAKEEADLLAKRLEELERKLYDEIKTWNRAERRLSKAMKKLESLNILHAGLPVSDSSTGSLSPSNGFSGHRASELDQETKPNSSLIDQLGLSGRFGSEDGGGDTPTGGSSVGSCAPVNTQSDCCEEHQMNLQGIGVGDHDADRERQHVVASESSAKSEDCCNEEENKLALVLVDRQPDVKAEDEVKMEANAEASKLEEKLETESNVNVQAVLLALRQVKEHLQCMIEIRSEFLAKKEELYGH